MSQIETGDVFTSEGLTPDQFGLYFPFLFHPNKETLQSIIEHEPVMFFEETSAASAFINGRPRFWSAYFMGEDDFHQLNKLRKQSRSN